MGDEQDTLPGVEPAAVTTGRAVGNTVWVVAADMMGGSHPKVLGVYTNEDAAREHEQHIRSRGGVVRRGVHDYPVASFWTYEKPVEQGFDPDDQ